LPTFVFHVIYARAGFSSFRLSKRNENVDFRTNGGRAHRSCGSPLAVGLGKEDSSIALGQREIGTADSAKALLKTADSVYSPFPLLD
jgi:hypothetical protein